jgi:hypothetical protein
MISCFNAGRRLRWALTCTLSFLAVFPVLAAPAASQPSRPNLLFILADDLGWSDTTLFGTTKFYQTPNLERLAKRGMLFTRAYSASPLSSPTRASILTGQNPARIGITAPNCHLPQVKLEASVQAKAPAQNKALQCESATRLHTNCFTLAKALKQAGAKYFVSMAGNKLDGMRQVAAQADGAAAPNLTMQPGAALQAPERCNFTNPFPV